MNQAYSKIPKRCGTKDCNVEALKIARIYIIASLLITIYFSSMQHAYADDKKINTDSILLKATSLLVENCIRCHYGKNSPGGFSILEFTKTEAEHTNITIYNAIKSGAMPPSNVPRRIDLDQLNTLSEWKDLENGKLKFNSTRTFIPLKDSLTEIRNFLQDQKENERPFFRFLDIRNVHNDPLVLDDEFQLYFFALSKAINSISQSGDIHAPKILPNETTLVIDLRDYGWHQTNAWNRLALIYPYGINFKNDDELENLETTIIKETKSFFPIVRGDWFIANALRDPIYRDFLGLPDTLQKLLSEANINFGSIFDVNEATTSRVRSGLSRSGVSRNNRIIERHSGDKFVWLSYDFSNQSERSNIFRFPLGPSEILFGSKSGFPDLEFAHAGGESIFELNNGLHGYALFDNVGSKVNAAPVTIVSDPKEVSGTPEIVNAISCFKCHSRGIIPAYDEVRGNSAARGKALALTNSLYGTKDSLKKIFQKDIDAYESQINSTRQIPKFTKHTYRTSDNIPIPANLKENQVEPISFAVRHFNLSYNNMSSLGLAVSVESNKFNLADRLGKQNLTELGIKQLLADRGAVNRSDWEKKNNGLSLFQEVAAKLDYTPVIFSELFSLPQSLIELANGSKIDLVKLESDSEVESSTLNLVSALLQVSGIEERTSNSQISAEVKINEFQRIDKSRFVYVEITLISSTGKIIAIIRCEDALPTKDTNFNFPYTFNSLSIGNSEFIKTVAEKTKNIEEVKLPKWAFVVSHSGSTPQKLSPQTQSILNTLKQNDYIVREVRSYIPFTLEIPISEDFLGSQIIGISGFKYPVNEINATIEDQKIILTIKIIHNDGRRFQDIPPDERFAMLIDVSPSIFVIPRR